ncbi:hypothetical protein [Candidatus Nitrosocosmicus sp. T]
MIYRNILVLFLFTAVLSYSASYLLSETFAQSSLTCINGNMGTNNSTMIEEGESSLISLGNSNMQGDFNSWQVISGIWNDSSSLLEGGTGNSTASPVENIIINPSPLENLSQITTTFKINEIHPNASNYVYIIYSYIDPDNFKMAGVHEFIDDIFVRFVEIANGCLTTEPNYIYTGLNWQPNSTFNLALTSEDGFQGLRLNGTQFAGNNDTNIDGITGLYYGRIHDINFYDFSTQIENTFNQNIETQQSTTGPNQITKPNLELNNRESFITSDTESITLGDMSIPSNNYIHIYDSSPYKIMEGHISAKLPCDEDNNTDILVTMGQINQLQTVTLESIDELSDPGNLCQYHADIKSTNESSITDIAIQNNSTEEIEFPTTSSVIVSVTEMSKLL